MNTYLRIIGIICVVLFIVAIGVFFILIRLKKLKKDRVSSVKKTLEGRDILHLIPAANSFGQTSLGISQIRGAGVLAFLEDEIYFLMWIPKKELRIPMSSIKNIDTSRSHLGKTNLRQLLKIHFTNDDGKDDSIAWMVSDLDEVHKKLNYLFINKK